MLSVIVPLYNEENGCVEVINAISDELKGFVEFEIVAVNDGSSDNTLAKLKEVKLGNFRVLNHVENLGYGKSLYDGICIANYNTIAIIDGDGSYPISEIKTLLRYYPQYDMVVGARTGNEYNKGLFKRPARRLFKFLSEYACGRNIPDINSGLRVFRKDIVLMFSDSLCSGFSFTTTITLLFFLNNYFIKYVPIDYQKRIGSSKVSHFRDTLRALQIIIEAVLYYNPIKLFLLIGSLTAIAGLLFWLVDAWVYKNMVLEIMAGVLISSFFLIFSLGLLADQLKKLFNASRKSSAGKT